MKKLLLGLLLTAGLCLTGCSAPKYRKRTYSDNFRYKKYEPDFDKLRAELDKKALYNAHTNTKFRAFVGGNDYLLFGRYFFVIKENAKPDYKYDFGCDYKLITKSNLCWSLFLFDYRYTVDYYHMSLKEETYFDSYVANESRSRNDEGYTTQGGGILFSEESYEYNYGYKNKTKENIIKLYNNSKYNYNWMTSSVDNLIDLQESLVIEE